MQAIQVEQTGGPDVLKLRELSDLTPGPGEALVRLAASGVNFIDVYYREGRYPAKLPLIPGQEGAGVVAALGEGASGIAVGDRVAWCGVQGAYAELAVVPADRLVKIPEGVGFEQAAGVMLQGMTAHYLLHASYAVRPGDEVLIHAGAGGVGLLFLQMAKQLGARVFTTVSTDEKAQLAREAGADEVILYTHEDFAARVRDLTEGRGVAAVYDSVGRTTFEGSLASLRRRGTLVLFGASSGAVPPFDLIRLSQMGSLSITRPKLNDFIVTREELEARAGDVLASVANGSLKLRMEHTYPLAEAARAHRDLEARRTTGKVLLAP